VNATAGSEDQLSEAATHFNRQKIDGQAKQLVARYNKHRDQLPVAEAALAQLLAKLQHTPPGMRPQLVQQMKQELRAMAMSEWVVHDCWDKIHVAVCAIDGIAMDKATSVATLALCDCRLSSA